MSILPWLVIAALIAVNALYVAGEFAAVAVDHGQIAARAREGDRRAASLLEMLEDGVALDRAIAACQIGITLSSLVVGAYGQATIAPGVAVLFARAFDLGDDAAQSSAFVLVLVVLTALQVVLGELVPKSLALQFTERAALATHPALRWSVRLYRGFIWVLNGSGFLLLRPFGVTPGGHEHVHSADEIAVLIDESRRGGALSPEMHRRLERGLHLSERTVDQIMQPREAIFAMEVSIPPAEVIERALQSPYSRWPVYRGSLDHVIGAVSTKDVVRSLVTEGGVPPLERLARPIPRVPSSLPAHELVRRLQHARSSKALVVDEQGRLRGLVSIEDVLGDLFGGVGDELKPPLEPAGREPEEAR